MGSPLPNLDFETFRLQLSPVDSSLVSPRSPGNSPDGSPGDILDGIPDNHPHESSSELSEAVLRRLYAHYQELRLWNPKLSLIGPGTAGHLVSRHYGESLAALPWIADSDRVLLDLGSGGGFPGLVLAACRPDLQVVLVEARQRKWAFLKAASRRCGLSCQCLNARVERSLPGELSDTIDIVTSRAVALSRQFFEVDHSPSAKILLWQGDRPLDLPPDAKIVRERRLSASQQRRLVEVRNVAAAA